METRIKICGLTAKAGIDAAIRGGADYIGLVHYAPSPRHVSLEQAAELRAYAHEASEGVMKVVLLTVDLPLEELTRAENVIGPDVLQCHGNETPAYLQEVKAMMPQPKPIWKALGVVGKASLNGAAQFKDIAAMLLYDAPAKTLPGGNGEAFDWHLLAGFDHQIPWGLAGGLTPDNVAEAIRISGTKLVDTSSGVESAPGVKDPAKIIAFCRAARDARAAA